MATPRQPPGRGRSSLSPDDLSILSRLARLAGIATDYTDIWGESHTLGVDTLLSFLATMGVLEIGQRPADAYDKLEAEPWRRGLEPVHVVRRSATPYLLAYRCPEAWVDRPHRWSLVLEDGEVRRGEFRPWQLGIRAGRDVFGSRYVEAPFYWHEPLPLGYHRYELEGPAEHRFTTSLIVVPERCHLPPALEAGARLWGPSLFLSSLRSGRNWGIGDYTDLEGAVAILGRWGADLVGLPPLHALFLHDPTHRSPYSPSSRLFLNALHLDPEGVPEYAECPAARALVGDPSFVSRLEALRASPWIDHAEVARLKLETFALLYRHFREHHVQTGSARGRAFARWCAECGGELGHFALYQTLQEELAAGHPERWGWTSWPAAYRRPTSPVVRAFAAAHRERVDFHAWLAWLGEEALARVADRAREADLGIGLYRDLALSADRAGAEVWTWQDHYAEGVSIGAPPDDFCLQGQDWGLPPFVPSRLRERAYRPFVELLRANMRHAGALRLDHVMGLFRLFWVPMGEKPAAGGYVHYPFEDLLGIVALESVRHGCLVVGEDLGTVPDEVRRGLARTGVLSYRLLLFEKGDDGSFRPPAAYPRAALVAVGTHDLPTLAGYWLGSDIDLRTKIGFYPDQDTRTRQMAERLRDRTELLLALEREGLLPAGIDPRAAPPPELLPELVLAIHAFLAHSPAALMAVRLEDVLGDIDPVNLPGTTHEYQNWSGKLSLALEKWDEDRRLLALVETLRALRGTARRRRHRGTESDEYKT